MMLGSTSFHPTYNLIELINKQPKPNATQTTTKTPINRKKPLFFPNRIRHSSSYCRLGGVKRNPTLLNSVLFQLGETNQN
jgi:hypothetical protein